MLAKALLGARSQLLNMSLASARLWSKNTAFVTSIARASRSRARLTLASLAVAAAE
jgi:hypothetical protein